MRDEPLFETIRPRTKWLGRRIVHYASRSSTMDEARDLAAAGAEPGTVVVADEQTGGRGRLDRRWFSPPGSLLATLLVRNEIPVARGGLIAIAAGVALAEAIRILVRAPAKVKWPNDVWIGSRKVGGVLVESRVSEAGFELVLVGIGVNGNVRENEFPPELRTLATSVSQHAEGHVCLPALLKVFIERLEPYLDDLEARDGGRVLAEARAHSVVLGREVTIDAGGETHEGVVREFGANGELIVETSEGTKVIAAGDCELLRPIDPTYP